ncbi:MAG: PLP-dependent transferase, partial [Bifidobacteriaceae bacterium]|nr:PLP-dependent transferase [Bifidobacteriaceae bacterium]
MPTEPRPLSPASLVVAAGRPPRTQGAPVNPPVVLSSTYFSRGAPAIGEMVYTRSDTETWHAPEALIGRLEGAPGPGILFGSGMAAISAVFSLVPVGRRIVMPTAPYQMASVLADDAVTRGLFHVTRVDIADTAATAGALTTGASPALLWIESPTNPLLDVADLPALIDAAHAAGALVGVDNTFATPLGQQPLAYGADLVVHSVTKYLAGHSDVVLGAVVAADAGLDQRLR